MKRFLSDLALPAIGAVMIAGVLSLAVLKAWELFLADGYLVCL